MLDITIRRPKTEDKEKLHEFFKLVINDTFIKEGIENEIYDLEEEIQTKNKYLQYDLESGGKLRYFLIAEYKENIVGTIEYGKSSELIDNCTNGELKDFFEVGTIFVRPDYQKQGISNLLLNAIYGVLIDRDIEEFCLDSGYSNSQKVWTKKFGEPNYFIENYWGVGMHHMIWRIKLKGGCIEDVLMKYNFDEIIDRTKTESSKWDPATLREMFGEEDALPFWVADMDFKVAEPIIEALRKRVEHGIYGYSVRSDSYYQAIIDWTKRHFGWEIKREWIEYTPGIVPAVNYLVQALLRPGDKVLIQQPVYYPFKKSVENNGCHIVVNELKYNGDFYEIDFDDFEDKIKDPKVKMFILCSPHNPVSRVWTEEELRKMGEICLANDVIIISDEIHNDLVYSGNKHIMFGSLDDDLANISVTCTAPSKTFNLAGMQASNVIIPNRKMMLKYREQLERNNIGNQNPLSIVAVETAYREGEEWLEQLLQYLEGNIEFIKKYLAENLPKAKLVRPQATYLGWIDLREYESDGKKLEELVAKKGKVGFDGGSWFGLGGDGFLRINYACPRALLEEGLKRLRKAIVCKD